ncbi:MAG: tRNA glutamyl-Q(34) synthetase GluQRS [Rhodobacteraceae bacterium]|nr:tRNA glutamyl-Q(34) synthetase GluQRS [Paracoccaceae bacterium]
MPPDTGSRVTRFAPSPTGPLHLGHAYAAILASRRAGAQGRFLLRIEDIDQSRCKPEWEAQIFDDLHWLGLRWPEPVMRQSARMAQYREALHKLAGLGVLYPCRCRRGDIRAALSAPQEGAKPVLGPDGLVYPGTCRGRSMDAARPDDALRLDMRHALALIGPLSFTETGPLHAGQHALDPDQMLNEVGDVVLARRGMGASYHLSVVVDDAAQGVTEVTRGVDLFDATGIHVLLQALLELSRPSYWHHDLVRDEHGRRLAKRDDARAIAHYRAQGASAQDICAILNL